MMAGLPVSSIPHSNQKHHDGAGLESLQAIRHFKPTFIKTNQVSNMICKVKLLKWRIKRGLFLEQIITSSEQGISRYWIWHRSWNLNAWPFDLRDCQKLCYSKVRSWFLNIDSRATGKKKSDLCDIACIFVKWNTKTYWKQWPFGTQFRNNVVQFITV